MQVLPPSALALADRQHGIISRSQLIDHGVTPRCIDHRIGSLLVPVHPSTYRIVGARSTRKQQLWAATCHVTASAISHRAAAAAYGVLDERTAPIEVSVHRWSRPDPSNVVVHRSTDLSPRWIASRSGLDITTPARTVLDLGAVVAPERVERALDGFIRKGLLTEQQAVASLIAHARRGRRGCGVLRAILDVRIDAAGLESELEVRLRRVCRDHGLPQPVAQHEVTVGGRRRRIDFAYLDARIAIEVDGFEFHSSRRAFDDDRRRGNALELAGWLVLRFTWTDLRHRPGAVASEIRRAIAQRSAT